MLSVGPFVRNIGQAWRIRLLQGSVVLDFVVLGAIALYPHDMTNALSDALAAVTLSFLVALAWCAATLRCPHCGRPVLWHVMKRSGVNTWFAEILEARSCPICGYTPDGNVGL